MSERRYSVEEISEIYLTWHGEYSCGNTKQTFLNYLSSLSQETEEKELTIRGVIPTLKVGDRVRLRGDMGGFEMTVKEVHNEWFCKCDYNGTDRHINMLFLELLSQETEEKQLDTHVLEVVRRTNTHELLSVASTVKEAEEEARLKLKDGETFYIRTFYEGGYSPHLDRKIEPLSRTDLEAEFGTDGYLRGYLLNSDGVDKIKTLFSAVNQLQEVRRP